MDWVDNFTSLPFWAQVLAIVVFAASAGIFIAVTRLGISVGRREGGNTVAPAATVAAMIVDPTAINAATAEVAGLSVVMHEVVVVLREAAAQQRRTADELDAVREEMRIHREIRRIS